MCVTSEHLSRRRNRGLAKTLDGWQDQRRDGSGVNMRRPDLIFAVEVTGRYSNRQIAQLAARPLDVVLEIGG